MKRYFADCISEILVSDDQSVVSLVCSNKVQGNVMPEFQVVLPKSSFISMAAFFSAVKKQLERTDSANQSKEKHL